jgi:hypothetical protein
MRRGINSEDTKNGTVLNGSAPCYLYSEVQALTPEASGYKRKIARSRRRPSDSNPSRRPRRIPFDLHRTTARGGSGGPCGVQGRRRHTVSSPWRGSRMAGVAVLSPCAGSPAPAVSVAAAAGGHRSGPVPPGFGGCAARARLCAWVDAEGPAASGEGLRRC